MLLKKKKYLENLIHKTSIQLSNIEQLVNDIEFAQIEVEVLDGLKCGNKALQDIQKVMSLDDAERIMSEAQDAVEYQRVSCSIEIVHIVSFIRFSIHSQLYCVVFERITQMLLVLGVSINIFSNNP